MSDAYRVETRTVDGGATALGWAHSGAWTLTIDRTMKGAGRGLGFNGGHLFYLAIAACISNDLYRDAQEAGITLTRVAITVDGDFPGGRGSVSTPIEYDIELEGDAPQERLDALLDSVDAIAEIPNSIRRGTQVRLRGRQVSGS